MVQEFFSLTNLTSLNLEAGEYTKEMLFEKFGMLVGGAIDQGRAIRVDQRAEGVMDADFVERAFIWGTTAFQLSGNTRFVVTAAGERYIKNYAAEPYVPPNRPYESFDFSSDDRLTNNIVNPYLQPRLDPSEIGREVRMTFNGDRAINNADHFTFTDYALLKAQTLAAAHVSNTVTGGAILNSVKDIFTQNLFSQVAKTLDEFNRPILYGTKGVDVLSETFSASDAPLLFPYKSNGVVLIGGSHADKLIGGEGYSSYFVGNGDKIATRFRELYFNASGRTLVYADYDSGSL